MLRGKEPTILTSIINVLLILLVLLGAVPLWLFVVLFGINLVFYISSITLSDFAENLFISLLIYFLAIVLFLFFI